MSRTQRVVSAVLVGLLFGYSSTAHAQGAIAGVVRDTSGAVLPGVTVEASSPVLIDKSRSVVTDATGQYQMSICATGYTVTFRLVGFNTVKGEGVSL